MIPLVTEWLLVTAGESPSELEVDSVGDCSLEQVLEEEEVEEGEEKAEEVDMARMGLSGEQKREREKEE